MPLTIGLQIGRSIAISCPNDRFENGDLESAQAR